MRGAREGPEPGKNQGPHTDGIQDFPLEAPSGVWGAEFPSAPAQVQNAPKKNIPKFHIAIPLASPPNGPEQPEINHKIAMG